MQYQFATNRYTDDFWQQVVNGVPRYIGALALLIAGYIVAKIVAAIVRKVLTSIKLDERLHSGRGGNVLQRAVPSPAGFASKLTFWIIFLFAVSLTVSVLGIPVLIDFVRGIYAYIPNIIAAILIFLAASAVSAAIATLVTNTMGNTPTGKVMAAAGPVVVMGLAVFMILNQLRIAPAIVTITYAALVGSAALGMALAFGLGGRDVAAQILQGLYEKGQETKGAVAADVRRGARTAKSKGDDLRSQI